MKRLSLLSFMLLGALLTFTACNDDDEPNPDQGSNELIDDYNNPEELKRRLPGSITTDRTLTADTTYYIDGYVFVEGGTLTIEPGTVIMGVSQPTGENPGNESALIITREAQIDAEGTPQAPIIFTSELDSEALGGDISLNQTNSKLWAGLIILGKAEMNVGGATEVQIEGIPDGEARALYGGNDNDHSSGILKYVSIRFTGAEIGPGDEIQGLTLGGVGRETVIEDIDIFVSGDDGIEIFGGTVNIKRVSVAFAEDDAFDFDLGWSGYAQFVFALQGGNESDHLGEWDGASPDDSPLYCTARIYNATFIGRGLTDGSRSADAATILMRDGAAISLYNSIITEANGKGLEVEDRGDSFDSYNKLVTEEEYTIGGNVWYAGNATGIADMLAITSGATDANGQAIIDHLNANGNSFMNPMLGGIGRTNGSGTLNPIPGADLGAPVATPTEAETVNYKGAFNPSGASWIAGWTTLARFGYLAD
ncbi:hypothetical protein [Penaeicola halotolerans]|uniref:hypothetical protein n=1 Tax=Penaeicola halotolerans TaxID=2793196 RepID=UPI001CF8F617|nr:hypothetical protein [Penaeicola halotolerans]